MSDDQAVAELKARCGDLQTGIERATVKLRTALLTGEDTSALRRSLAELGQELDKGRAEFDELMQRVTDERERRLGAEAGSVAAQAAASLKKMLATLAPPPAPNLSVH